jgi:hypothetical protein
MGRKTWRQPKRRKKVGKEKRESGIENQDSLII